MLRASDGENTQTVMGWFLRDELLAAIDATHNRKDK